ncbi:MAG: hypothetical protein ACI8WB_002831 [Phenylobacterium sp.]|jgi:hypothetical protein
MDLNQTNPCDNICDAEPSQDNTELAAQITLLAAYINAATYRFLKFLAEFDRRQGWGGVGISSCAQWLNWKCGISDNAARERVRIAHCLENLPLINKAFENGAVSYSKVRAMTRVATDDNEEYLLSVANYGTANQMEKLVRKYEKVEKNQQKSQQPQDHQQLRELTCRQDDNGMWNIHIKLPQEEGGLVVKAIEEVMRQQDKPLPDVVGYTPISNPPNVSAETFLPESDLIDDADPELEIVEKCNFGQKRADAFTAIIEHYTATASNGVKPLAGHERCQVVLHLDVDTLKHAHDCKQEDANHSDTCGCHAPLLSAPYLDQQWISLENAKRLSCDASLLTVLEDKDGNVFNMGRNARTVAPALKRILDIRDETCRFPGCCESNYVDFHHIQHWAEGGETNPDNLMKLCRFHHLELHKGSYIIEAQTSREDNKQAFIFKTSAGEVMEPSPKLPICTVKSYFERQWPEVTSLTGNNYPRGEKMDYGMAIDGLVQSQQQPEADVCY